MSWLGKKITVDSEQGIIEGNVTSVEDEENGDTYVNFTWQNEQWAGKGSVAKEFVEDAEDNNRGFFSRLFGG